MASADRENEPPTLNTSALIFYPQLLSRGLIRTLSFTLLVNCALDSHLEHIIVSSNNGGSRTSPSLLWSSDLAKSLIQLRFSRSEPE